MSKCLHLTIAFSKLSFAMLEYKSALTKAMPWRLTSHDTMLTHTYDALCRRWTTTWFTGSHIHINALCSSFNYSIACVTTIQHVIRFFVLFILPLRSFLMQVYPSSLLCMNRNSAFCKLYVIKNNNAFQLTIFCDESIFNEALITVWLLNAFQLHF